MNSSSGNENETRKHILEVARLLHVIARDLLSRADGHDGSKLEDPERAGFDVLTENLSNLDYGTEAYYRALASGKETIDHHYAKNRHHPEHWKNGITDMSLVDLIEALCDWKASSSRTKNGNILKSLDINAKRFHIDHQLLSVLTRTVTDYFPD